MMQTLTKIAIGAIIVIVIALAAIYVGIQTNGITFTSMTGYSSSCTGFNDIALSGPVDYVSNDPKLGTKSWLLTVVQNCMGRYAVGTIDSQEIKDTADKATAEYDLKISTTVDEQKCEYPIQVQGKSIRHMNYETKTLYLGIGSGDWENQCEAKTGYRYFQKKGWDYTCWWTTTTAQHGVVGTSALTFKSTITLEAKGEKHTQTISSYGPGSVYFDNNIAYVYWNGNLVSGEQCPIASDYKVSAAYQNGAWRTIDESVFQSYLTYDESGFYNCLQRYVDYGTETPKSCQDSYSYYESNALSGKTLTSSGGSVATVLGTLSNGKVYLELSKLIQYPMLSMKINANWIGIYIPVGKPQITFVSSQPFQTGTNGIINVEVKNIGTALGAFGVYAECPSGISQTGGTQYVDVLPNEIGKVSIPVTATCGEETTKTCTVYAYDRNNPAEKVSKSVSATCKPIILCTAGEMRCNGNWIEQCNDKGSGWVQKNECKDGCEIKNNVPTCKEIINPCNYNSQCEPERGENVYNCIDCGGSICNNNLVCESDLGENAQNCSDCQDWMTYAGIGVLIIVVAIFVYVAYKQRKPGRKRYYRR